VGDSIFDASIKKTYEKLEHRVFRHGDQNSRLRSKPEHIPHGECRMAKAGAGNASLRSHDSASLSAYIAGIDLFFAGNVSAHEDGSMPKAVIGIARHHRAATQSPS
jgi:hypothetical protein